MQATSWDVICVDQLAAYCRLRFSHRKRRGNENINISVSSTNAFFVFLSRDSLSSFFLEYLCKKLQEMGASKFSEQALSDDSDTKCSVVGTIRDDQRTYFCWQCLFFLRAVNLCIFEMVTPLRHLFLK